LYSLVGPYDEAEKMLRRTLKKSLGPARGLVLVKKTTMRRSFCFAIFFLVVAATTHAADRFSYEQRFSYVELYCEKIVARYAEWNGGHQAFLSKNPYQVNFLRRLGVDFEDPSFSRVSVATLHEVSSMDVIDPWLEEDAILDENVMRPGSVLFDPATDSRVVVAYDRRSPPHLTQSLDDFSTISEQTKAEAEGYWPLGRSGGGYLLHDLAHWSGLLLRAQYMASRRREERRFKSTR
jgi:hypothetical protein